MQVVGEGDMGISKCIASGRVTHRLCGVFFVMIRRPPRSTLSPCTTLFRSLRKGTVAVAVGETVSTGQRLGEIGMSGAAEFPHVDRKSTRLNSSHKPTSYAVFCLRKKKSRS